jgi:2-polyprenyl-6-hydroxyphenyl methylase/3-demethylubiquinone-9 3-methyltransferase
VSVRGCGWDGGGRPRPGLRCCLRSKAREGSRSLHAEVMARALIRGPFARLVQRLPTIVPPAEFPCRIERLEEGSATLDNELYGDATHAASWHQEDASHELATLRLLNSARIPYFDRHWRSALLLGPARAGSFLEIGCGGGICTAALAELGYSMTGVEPQTASLEAAREHARRLGLQERLSFVKGSAYDLTMFPPRCFEGVVMADVLEHLYDLPTAVAQAWRVLKPGGVLVFDTINRTFASHALAIALAQEGLQMVPPHTHDWRMFIKPHELAYLLQAHGFVVDTATFRGMAPTVALRNPITGASQLVQSVLAGTPPRLPLSDFIEIASLEVNYLGHAIKPTKPRSQHANGGEAADGGEAVDDELPPRHAPGELARGLREARRTAAV